MEREFLSDAEWNTGELLEARVAQVWFWEGAFARRGIDLKRHFASEPFLVTDVDLLAIDIDSTLTLRRTIGEAKAGTGSRASRPLDRAIWLRGLMEVTGARSGELTTQLPPSRRVRELALPLGVIAQSVEDLERREANLRIEETANRGVFGVKWVGEQAHVRKVCAAEADLERAYWLLCSEVWFLDPFPALKQTIATLRSLAGRWTPAAVDDVDFSVRWLLCEGTVLATLNLVAIAGHALRLGGDSLLELVGERLTTALLPTHYMRAVSRSFDRYLAGVLRDVGAPESAIEPALGAFEPKPPDYAPQVAEVAAQLAADSIHARHLPRWADLMCYERVLRHQEPEGLVVARLATPDIVRVAQAGRLVAGFLKEHAGLPEPLVSALGEGPQELRP